MALIFSQRLRLSDVSRDVVYEEIVTDLTSPRFLYADPTPGALEVFVQDDEAMSEADSYLPPEQGDVKGIWIKADPLPNCVVCNIGDSRCIGHRRVSHIPHALQCGRFGPAACINLLFIE